MDADGQNATVLVDDPNASVLSFSVCGDHYLLLSWAYHAGNRLNIWRTNADGSAPKQLTSGDFERSPICSPDGKWVYFIDRPGTSRLMRVSVDGGASEPLPASNVPNQFGIEGISFIARDGKSVGFVVDVVDTHTNDAQTKLAIVKLEAGSNAPPRLLDLDARLGSPKNFGVAFGNGGVQPLPNLTGVAYPITENGVNNVWLQPLDGSPGHTNSLTSQVISDFHWAPNGKTLARRRQSGSVRTVTWAASTSRKRSRELPCLLMWPSRRRSPLDSSDGTSPT